MMLEGQINRRQDHAAILVVGHLAGRTLAGSERSLLDVLDGFLAIGKDVVVVVPPGVLDNSDYLERLLERSCFVHVEPLPWRVGTQRTNNSVLGRILGRFGLRRLRTVAVSSEGDCVVRRLCEIISFHRIRAVHVNTIVLREPLAAARRCGVPAVLHAREIPTEDAKLCDILGSTADRLVADILDEADFVVANSRATANTFPLSGRTSVVPNVIACDLFPARSTINRDAPRVVLAGSLISKKGIRLFRKLASQLAARCDARFLAVGPSSVITDAWVREGLPDNLELPGYMPTPEAVMSQADIVVSMSIFTESFGRTLIEAMAAGLPVVAFDQGGPAEIVIDGVTGTLVPPGDVDAFAAAVLALCRDPELRLRMGQAGRERVENKFAPARLAEALRETYEVILPPADVLSQSCEDRRLALPTENRSSHRSASFVGWRARFSHCTDVAFLDDHTLVTASLLGKRIYLVSFDPQSGASSIVAELATTGLDGETSVVLLDTDAHGRIVTADCEKQSITVYRRDDQSLVRETTLPVPAGGFCHGACFVPGASNLVCAAVTTGDVGLHLLSLESGKVQLSIRLPGWRPKSAAFVASDRLVAGWSRNNVNQEPGAHHESLLTDLCFTQQGSAAELVNSQLLPGRSLDGLRIAGDRVFETDQIANLVNEWQWGDLGFRLVRTYAGFSFPHGVAVSPSGEWLAVAEYGTNAIALRRRRQTHLAIEPSCQTKTPA